MIRRTARRIAESFGYTIQRKVSDARIPGVPGDHPSEFPSDFTVEEHQIWDCVRPYTLTSEERIVSLIRAVQYLERYHIPGALVECGVWRGGSMMAVAKTLVAEGVADRELFLFDTYSGMPDPTEQDLDVFGRKAADVLAQLRTLPSDVQSRSHVLAQCPLEAVRSNLSTTGYPPDKLHFVVGKVEDTVPRLAPNQIALLRLDTDWYESTRHELVHLFPRLSRHGILILDDYFDWLGARRAVDEFFEQYPVPIFLSRVDRSGRIAVRC